MKRNAGFTLIEILITAAIMGLMAVVIVGNLSSYSNKLLLSIETYRAVSFLLQARSQAISGRGGSAFGVHLGSQAIALYQGDTYTATSASNRVLAVNDLLEIASVTLAGGGADVVFSRLSGKTEMGGSFTIRYKSDISNAKTINIEPSGIAQAK